MTVKRAERILVVEDSPTVRLQLSVALEREGFVVATASDGASGIEQVRSFAPHCVLLDYYLPDMTGEQVVSTVRGFDRSVQIVLVTGRSAEQPAREMMRRLDIQGFHDKGDGMARLLVWVESALKAHARSTRIERQASGLRQILGSTGVIHRIQPVEELYAHGLAQMGALLQAERGSSAVSSSLHGLAVRFDTEGGPQLPVLVDARGRYVECRGLDALDVLTRRFVLQLAEAQAPCQVGSHLGVPVRVGERVAGGFVLDLEPDAASGSSLPIDYLQLLATQVALALENIRLYQMATVDAVTGLMSRAYMHQRLIEWLKIVVRTGQPLSLVYLDMDKFKPINDTHGHLVGDAVLAELGRRLSQAVRDVDNAGRVGGDEFLITLPSATPQIARRIAERIRDSICDAPAVVRGMRLEMCASIGVGGFELLPLARWMRAGQPEATWHRLAQHFVEQVDTACYEAKRRGGARVVAVDEDGSELAQRLIDYARQISVA